MSSIQFGLSKKGHLITHVLLQWLRLIESFGGHFSSCGSTRSQLILCGWSRQAELTHNHIDENEPQSINIFSCESQRKGNRVYDLSSPREWLEYYPDGAYTVLRCDFKPNVQVRGGCQLWGSDFHINRLCSSYQNYLAVIHTTAEQQDLDIAAEQSKQMIRQLVAEAGSELASSLTDAQDNAICTGMVTVLWHPNPSDQQRILVRGHVYTNEIAADPVSYNPDPLSIMIALPSNDRTELPHRKGYFPEAKLSAWCSERRPLEERFKTEIVDEVLLADTDGGVITLLEGLTSNFFAVYPGNIIRTASRDVLGGYARSLVLEYATKLGFKVELTPVCMHEAALWEEVFITSSIKLIAPVDKVLIPSNDEHGSPREIWSLVRKGDKDAVWRRLYEAMIRDQPQFSS